MGKLKLPRRLPKRFALLGLALFFVAAGVNHFANPDFYVQMMPPWLPAHLELVYLSGAFEILGGAGVLVPRARGAAGWGLVALLVAVFPANLYMASNPELFPDLSQTALYLRLPLQVVLIAWALWATRPDRVQPASGLSRSLPHPCDQDLRFGPTGQLGRPATEGTCHPSPVSAPASPCVDSGMSRKRPDMTARVVPLGSKEAGEPPTPSSPEERIALVHALTREAWELAGRPIPDYSRDEMPIAVSSLSDQGRS